MDSTAEDHDTDAGENPTFNNLAAFEKAQAVKKDGQPEQNQQPTRNLAYPVDHPVGLRSRFPSPPVAPGRSMGFPLFLHVSVKLGKASVDSQNVAELPNTTVSPLWAIRQPPIDYINAAEG